MANDLQAYSVFVPQPFAKMMKGTLLYLLAFACAVQASGQRDSNIDPRCPYPDPEDHTVHLPHEWNCSQFYKCNRGRRVLFNCPGNLYFNEELEVCDLPENVKCTNSPSPTIPPPPPPSNPPSNPPPPPTSPPSSSSASPAGPSEDCPFPDPEYPVLLPDPSDPTKFYKCSNGVPHPIDCPEGLHFNPYLNVCDYPGFTPPPSPPSSSAPPSPAGECPETDSDYPVLLPDLSDPTKFYKCSHGVPYPIYCPEGLHFNPYLNVCDYPGFSPPPPSSPAPPSSSPSEPSSPPSAPAGPSGECPATDPEYPVLLPDLSDPTKFYKCSNGVPHLIDCPEGLHFNPYLNVCDYPGFTPPPSPPSSSAPPSPAGECPETDSDYPVLLPDLSDPTKFYKCSHGVPYPIYCPDGLHFNPYLNVCDYPGFSPPPPSSPAPPSSSPSEPSPPPSAPAEPSGECPFPDPEYPVYLPDASDPGKFYKCSNGIPHPYDCPQGLHFNPYLNVCDYPGFTSPPPPPSSTTSSPPAAPAGECPFPDPEYPVYLTDLSDPSKFYECSNGVPYPFDCPANLHFNPYLNVCDYPGFTAPPASGSPSTSASTSPPSGPVGYCPETDSEHPVYLTDASNPSRFYECAHGVPHPFDCPTGSTFNPNENVCS